MSDASPIPATSREWRECIEVRCKIRLTSKYVADRLAELQNTKHPKTQEFAKLYGANHLQQTIGWFRQAAKELG